MHLNLVPTPGTVIKVHCRDGKTCEIDETLIDRIEVTPLFPHSKGIGDALFADAYNVQGKKTDSGILSLSGGTGAVRLRSRVRSVVPLVDMPAKTAK